MLEALKTPIPFWTVAALAAVDVIEYVVAAYKRIKAIRTRRKREADEVAELLARTFFKDAITPEQRRSLVEIYNNFEPVKHANCRCMVTSEERKALSKIFEDESLSYDCPDKEM